MDELILDVGIEGIGVDGFETEVVEFLLVGVFVSVEVCVKAVCVCEVSFTCVKLFP